MLKERHIKGSFYGRSIVHFYLGSIDFEPPDDTMPPTEDIHNLINAANSAIYGRLSFHLLERGISSFDVGFYVFSAAHSKEDVNQTIKAFGDSLDIMISEGTFKADLIE